MRECALELTQDKAWFGGCSSLLSGEIHRTLTKDGDDARVYGQPS